MAAASDLINTPTGAQLALAANTGLANLPEIFALARGIELRPDAAGGCTHFVGTDAAGRQRALEATEAALFELTSFIEELGSLVANHADPATLDVQRLGWRFEGLGSLLFQLNEARGQLEDATPALGEPRLRQVGRGA